MKSELKSIGKLLTKKWINKIKYKHENLERIFVDFHKREVYTDRS